MSHPRSGCASCAPACAVFAVDGFHVTAIEHRGGVIVLEVQTDPVTVGCPACGVLAEGRGRRLHRLADAPAFGLPVQVRWSKRLWRCIQAQCPVRSFSETHPFAQPRARLTARAVGWATGMLRTDDTTVAALARRLGVGWHTLWRAIQHHAQEAIGDVARLGGVTSLGVDEHIWKPSCRGADRAVTSMVDLTRDEHGRVRARLLDVVPGRSGTAYAAWLRSTPEAFAPAIEHAALDPFRGYANAIRDELPEAVAVLDAFHVVRLGAKALDECRQRVQQETLGHRGRKDDPLYRIRALLRHGQELLSDRQKAKLTACLAVGDPHAEVEVAWLCYQQLRSAYHQERLTDGRVVAARVLESFHTCPIPEIARLGRTLRAWRQQFLAYFDTGGVSNGGTEAINLIIEKTRRLAHGFRNFDNYRLRILLAAGGHKPWRTAPTPAS